MTLELRIERARRLLAGVEKNYSPAALASSFGAEDMVLLDLIARDGLAIQIFTLDTGRLPRQTHALIEKVRKQYAIEIDVFSPWPDSVEAFVAEHGMDGFYDGVEQRKACCAVRKVEPLRRALAGKRGWITGLRREQSDTRAVIAESEYRPQFGSYSDSVGHACRDCRIRVRPELGPVEIQPARRLVGCRGLGLPARQQRALQRAARPRLPFDRLRALHARREAG